MYEVAANITLVIHFMFILFVIFGGLLYFFYKKFIFLHVPALFWGTYVELSHSICPLTYLENWFLMKAQLIEYSDGFVAKYIFPIVYPLDLTLDLQNYLGITLMVINVMIYGYIFRNKI